MLILLLFYPLTNLDINLTMRNERSKRRIPDTFKLTTFVTLKKIYISRIKAFVVYCTVCSNIIYYITIYVNIF